MEFTRQQFARLSEWFEGAVDLPPPERQAFLEKIRRDEGDAMADELARLLAANGDSSGTPTGTMLQPVVRIPAGDIHGETPAFREGDVILHRFRIVRLLGRGGMGEVYEAHDQELGRVALKTIRRDMFGDRALLQRFKQEVQLARQVTSPYVCRIHELFMVPDDGPRRVAAFLTMELLEGTTLARRIEQGPLPWNEAERIAVELCQGLEALHAAGLVHRDFKPGNAMLAKRGNVTQAVVMDLGLALRPEDSHARPKLTLTGGIVGTPGYMAPEQFEGAKVSAATDVYSLGLVLYEMTTGKRPFEASTPLAAAVKRGKRPPAISSIRPGLPRRLDWIVDKCLEFEPADRFGSAEEVAKALKGEVTASTRWPMLSIRTGRQRWVMAVALALALSALVTAGVLRGWSFYGRYRPREAALAWYGKGLEAFREGTYLKAEGLFQRALDADKEFGLARVHLAESWNELDFKGNADEAMAAVTAQQENEMGSRERDYAEAVRATLRQDFTEAVAGFKHVLEDSPETDKAAANVDLGRIEEKAGDIPGAFVAYRTARKLAPDSPAAYLRSAVLESRQGRDSEADADFDRASSLYRTLGALEGEAEVAYQRSNWQTARGYYETALALTQQSLDDARHMTQRSYQLEVRALCRFSAIYHGKGQEDQALEKASEAVSLAHENGLEYWETDALLRQSAAYYGKGMFGEAENRATNALRAANRNKWPRLIALAQMSLALVREAKQQHQDIAGLTSALGYYRLYQFPKESLIPLLYLVRDQNDRDQYEGGAKAGKALVSLATQVGGPAMIAQAEEAVGTSYLGLQQYPEALQHFDAALAAAQRSNDELIASYERLHRAETLGRLGRFNEAEQQLAGPKDERLGVWSSQIRGRLLSMQGRYANAVMVARMALESHPNLSPADAADFCITGSMAAAKTGALDQAWKWVRKAEGLAQQVGDPETVANISLARATLNLKTGSLQDAKSSAQEALTFYQAHGQSESEWLTWYHLALIEKALGSNEEASQSASKSLYILSMFEHNWSVSAALTYERRPDVSAAAAELRRIAGRQQDLRK
jgi:tetratricopeptide (TPR) repeat protein